MLDYKQKKNCGKIYTESSQFMQEIPFGHFVCAGCDSIAPRSWIGLKGGAIQVGSGLFCSEKCYAIYLAKQADTRRRTVTFSSFPILSFK